MFSINSNEQINSSIIPQHVAIIMDGNGRWAQKKNKPRVFGHQKGAQKVRAVVEAASKWGVKVLTLFAFSEENWQRPNHEVQTLMTLINRYLKKERNDLYKKNVRFQTIGDLKKLPLTTQKIIQDTKTLTQSNTGLILNIAFSYSARAEIISACQSLCEEVKAGNLDPKEISPEIFANYLETSNLPDPDLLIRTSGEQRISNFLLWQLSYAELYFTDQLWPDFSTEDFDNAIKVFQSRDRRYGRVKEKGVFLPKEESSRLALDAQIH